MYITTTSSSLWNTASTQSTKQKSDTTSIEELLNLAQTNSTSSSGQTDIKDFLDKVKNGTVTDSDLSTIQDTLTKLKQKFGTTSPSLGTNGSDEITSFLDKVQSGTVTDSDLSSMKDVLTSKENDPQSMLTAMGSMMMPPPPPPPSSASGTTDSESDETLSSISAFLDKVKDGSVTSDDLATMQTLLASLGNQQNTAAAATSSDSTTATVASTASAAKDTFSAQLQSFLEKIKSGTVSDSDLSEMKEALASLKTQGESDFGSISSRMGDMSGMPPRMGSGEPNNDSSNQSNAYLQQQFINMAIDAYSQNNSADYSTSNITQNYSV